MNKYSIKRLYLFLVFTTITILVGFFSYIILKKQLGFLDYQINEFRKRLIMKENNLVKKEVDMIVRSIKFQNKIAQKKLKEELKTKVNIFSKLINSFYNAYKDKFTEEEMKEAIKLILRDIRVKKTGYFFIATTKGIEILYPIKPEFENKNIINLKDAKGNYVIKEEIKVVKEKGEGYVLGYWIKNPKTKKEFLKISYVKKLGIYDWYLGTGEYLDDFKNQIKKEVLRRLSNYRFGHSGYIYVNTYDGYSLLLNGKINKEPLYFMDKRDAKGNYTTRMQIEVVKKRKEGFITYYWNKIGGKKPIKKTAYVKGMDEWKWIVGAGYYHDEINAILKEARSKFLKEFYEDTITLGLFVFLILFFIVLLIYFINNFVSKQFDVFIKAFKRASLSNDMIKDEDIRFKELLELTNSINNIIKEKKNLEKEIFNKRRLESLGVLAGGIAHDFNNILTAILANINIAREYKDIDKIRNILSDAEEATERAKSLALQLLTFAKGGEPVLKVVNLGKFVKKTTEFLLSGSSISFNYSIEDNLWPVKADKGQIGQVIENIVINAKQAMPNGGSIYIKMENEILDDDIKYVKMTIKDTGEGISKENIDKIFDPYFTTKKDGNGLGLATVYSIVSKHKGIIYVRSKVGQGTKFIIYLPAVEGKYLKEEDSNVEIKVKNKRAVIMDDEEMILKISKKLFSHIGFEVVCVKNGEELLKEYKKSMREGNKFDIVIMDLTIHDGMGGEEAIKELLKLDKYCRVIVSSGYSNSKIVSNYKEYGFKGCLVKPYKLKDIKVVLHEVLNQKD